MDASSLRLGRPPRFSVVHEPCREYCWALVQAVFPAFLWYMSLAGNTAGPWFKLSGVRRARIKQRRAPSGERRLQGTLSTLSSTASPCCLTEHPSAGGGESRASSTQSSSKSREKTSSEARSDNDQPASNFTSILSSACVTTQPWTP